MKNHPGKVHNAFGLSCGHIINGYISSNQVAVVVTDDVATKALQTCASHCVLLQIGWICFPMYKGMGVSNVSFRCTLDRVSFWCRFLILYYLTCIENKGRQSCTLFSLTFKLVLFAKTLGWQQIHLYVILGDSEQQQQK